MIEAVQRVRWAPIKVPVRRRLQTFAVLFGLTLLPLCFACIGLFLFWKPLTDLYTREITLAYILWIVAFDSKTPLSGGRMKSWFRQLPTWKYIIDYFPARIFLPRGGYDKSKTYIFALHPHGIISMAAICNLAYDSVRPVQFADDSQTGSILSPGGLNGINSPASPTKDNNPGESRRSDEPENAESPFEDDKSKDETKDAEPGTSAPNDIQDPKNHASTSDSSNVSTSEAFEDTSEFERKASKSNLLPSVLKPPSTCALEAKLRENNGAVILKSVTASKEIDRTTPIAQLLHPSEAIGIPYRFLTVTFNFLVPIWREILLGMGFVSASKESAVSCLKKGLSVAVVVGGALESLDAKPGTADLTLARRKGFIKLALEQGANLVPVYNFGESELFEQVPNPKGSKLRAIQEKFIHWIGWTLPAFYGRGIFNYDCGILPRRVPLVTVFGSPVPVEKVENPTPQQVDALHSKYINALRELYDRYKDGYYEHLSDLGFRDQHGNVLKPVPLKIVG